MKKSLKVPLVSVAAVAGVLALGLAATTITNVAATAAEADELQPYGQFVTVDGKRMNVAISGDAAETIVLLPGMGTASPVLDFSPLVAELQDDFRVVVVEPFGYGLSDQADTERTSANIAGEVHEALQELGIDRYVLAGHSVAGIYALEYVDRFRDEVTAFVGIDTSVPTQPGMDEESSVDAMRAMKDLGLLRVLSSLGPDPYEGLPYDEATKRQLQILSNRNALSPTLLDEVAHTPANFAAARTQAFPADLPVLLFVVAKDSEVPGWLAMHEEQLSGVDEGRLVPLDGGHYLHHTNAAGIAADIAQFLKG